MCINMIGLFLFAFVATAYGGPATDSYKDQYCTDPRTMKKHAAYTEWADAYSCTRHRCQPGGRNLAIYTVGCKRVEAPESAIECEEVVEDTNIQFPYCCTRLRCLVVVRGEVWTRVLGQPWETLPAAPWSHMYKMKKPPPGDSSFLPKSPGEGPVYELTSDVENSEKVLRSSKTNTATENPDCNEVAPRAVPAPDIVIALSTANEVKDQKKADNNKRGRHKRGRKTPNASPFFDDEVLEHRNEVDAEDAATDKEKQLAADVTSEEKYFVNSFGVTQKPIKALPSHQMVWTENTEIPPNQWGGVEHDGPAPDGEATPRDGSHGPDFNPEEKKDEKEKPSNLQALVDAIGTRMRDIENVVQRMSEKVQQAKPPADSLSAEKRSDTEMQPKKHRNSDSKDRTKRPSPETQHYKRGSKYLHVTEPVTEQPLFVEDTNLNGYFSDASNNLLRRSNVPKEPAPTYMAPVENRRKAPHIPVSEASDEGDKKHKKHAHKKKKGKSKGKKKHHKDDKKRHNKVSSEIDRNVVSLEDSSAVAKK